MEIKQIYQFVNTSSSEVLGRENVVKEDLSNIVEVGQEIESMDKYDHYVKTLLNKIGLSVFVNRVYRGRVPSLLMSSWEYGSILEKISTSMPEASENESWELEDGETYNQDIFRKPTAEVKFFNKRVTFEIQRSFARRQVKESFHSVNEMNAFFSMLQTAVENSLTVKIDSLIMRTINNMIGETIKSGTLGVNKVNLLSEYNTLFGTSLTAKQCMTNPEFIRYAAMRMGVTADRLGTMSALFNIGGKERFTPTDQMHMVLLSDFAKGADVYLQSDVFHEQYTRLPKSETVPYWQGSGKTYAFEDISKINIKTASGTDIEQGGILGVMFDSYACAVCNVDRRVTSHYNSRAEFYNNWYKFDAEYMNDTNENFVVFYVA